jgi:hypothetical protein
MTSSGDSAQSSIRRAIRRDPSLVWDYPALSWQAVAARLVATAASIRLICRTHLLCQVRSDPPPRAAIAE